MYRGEICLFVAFENLGFLCIHFVCEVQHARSYQGKMKLKLILEGKNYVGMLPFDYGLPQKCLNGGSFFSVCITKILFIRVMIVKQMVWGT